MTTNTFQLTSSYRADGSPMLVEFYLNFRNFYGMKIKWGNDPEEVVSVQKSEYTHTFAGKKNSSEMINVVVYLDQRNAFGEFYVLKGLADYLAYASFDTPGITDMSNAFANSWIMGFTSTGYCNFLTTRRMFRNSKALGDKKVSFAPNSTMNTTDMSSMFQGCVNFNQAVVLNTQLVTNMESMFEGCKVFNQSLQFNIQALQSAGNMLSDTGLSSSNYTNILQSFTQNIVPSNINLGDVNAYRENNVAYDSLTNTYGWTITDLGTPASTYAKVNGNQLQISVKVPRKSVVSLIVLRSQKVFWKTPNAMSEPGLKKYKRNVPPGDYAVYAFLNGAKILVGKPRVTGTTKPRSAELRAMFLM